jgi:hypothetical protein
MWSQLSLYSLKGKGRLTPLQWGIGRQIEPE